MNEWNRSIDSIVQIATISTPHKPIETNSALESSNPKQQTSNIIQLDGGGRGGGGGVGGRKRT